MKNILIVLVLSFVAVGDSLFASTNYNYTLPYGASTYWTSAAVYDSNANLVRTLWRHVQKNAGPNSGSWDNLNDDGSTCPVGNYSIKVLYHNVSHQVDGVVGNTSAVRADSVEYWRSYLPPVSMANSGAAGSPIFISFGYNEGQSGCKRFAPASPQRVTDWLRADPFISIHDIATDGEVVYLAARDGLQATTVFVFAISATTANSFHIFSSGSDVRLNGAYEAQHYPSVIDLSTVPSGSNTDYATGIAVQRSGQGAGTFLAVSHGTLNTVRLYNKSTGQLIKSISTTAPGQVAFAANGDLWITTGTSIHRYGNLAGTPTLVATIASLSGPVAIASHPSSDLLLVADGGGSQQVKGFSNVVAGTVTTPTWSHGQPGGWLSNGTNAANDKFGFFLTHPGMSSADLVSPMVVLNDGSFWIGDTECNRLLHFTATRSYLERIMYRPASYTAAVDVNNPGRMFSDFIEYARDYSRPLQPGDPEASGGNGCWTFVKNWAAGQELTHPDVIFSGIYSSLKPVYTLSNGRTYGVVCHTNGSREVVELASSGLRYTGSMLTQNAELIYPDGSRRYISSYNTSGTVTWYKRALTGFDGSGNPQWAAASAMATVPVNAYSPNPKAAYFQQLQFLASSNNMLISFDPSKHFNGTGLPYTWHLGGVKLGAANWSWKGSPAVASEVPFLGVGNFDVGDGIQYAGAQVGVAGDQTVYAFNGEFYNGGQASQWMHFMDDGLFVGQFGTPATNTTQRTTTFAGNIYSTDMYSHGGEYYVYTNDESNNAGIMFWKLGGANKIAKMIGIGPRDGTIALTGGGSVVSDTFTSSNATILERYPATANLPDGFFEANGSATIWSAPQIQGNMARVSVDNGASVSLASYGGYTKPTEFVISATVNPGSIYGVEATRGIGLGFYSTTGGAHGSDNFTGLVLNPNGNLTLVQNGMASTAVGYGGAWVANQPHSLSYRVNTSTGGISNVVLDGQSKSYITTAFTNSATARAGFFASDADGVSGDGLVDDFRVSTVGGVDIIHDGFNSANGTVLVARSPANANLPARPFAECGSNWNEPQIQGNSCCVYVDGGLSVSMASTGSYNRPDRVSISGKLNPQAVNGSEGIRGVALGFYSAIGGAHAQDNFTGLALNPNGNLTLVVNGVAGSSQPYAGTWVANQAHSLSYSVDTATGAIANVILDGQSKTFTTQGFTVAATARAGFYVSDADGLLGEGRVDDFLVQVSQP